MFIPIKISGDLYFQSPWGTNIVRNRDFYRQKSSFKDRHHQFSDRNQTLFHI